MLKSAISVPKFRTDFPYAIFSSIPGRTFLHTAAANLTASTGSKNNSNVANHRRARLGEFTQPKPQLANPFGQDAFARTLLRVYVPDEARQQFEPDLNRFGQRIVDEIEALGVDCQRDQPRLISVDAWARPVNKLWVSQAWKQQKKIAAEEQFVRIGYERPCGEWRWVGREEIKRLTNERLNDWIISSGHYDLASMKSAKLPNTRFFDFL